MVRSDDEDDISGAEEGDEDNGGTEHEPDERDSRFFEQNGKLMDTEIIFLLRLTRHKVETGEEDEETVFSHRAKLYMIVNKEWKERGVGNLKLNIRRSQQGDDDDDDDDAKAKPKKTARFILRADGSHRLALNSPITKEINMRDPMSGPPKGKQAIFLGFYDGKPTTMQLKVSLQHSMKLSGLC